MTSPQRDEAPYGYCPECGAHGIYRERRIDGNDKCANGHTYPSRNAHKAIRQRDEAPTEAQLNSACLSYRHDFGLMDAEEQEQLRWAAKEWLHAWHKELAASPAAQVPALPNEDKARQAFWRCYPETGNSDKSDVWMTAYRWCRATLADAPPQPAIEPACPFSIVFAVCRMALHSPTDALLHQIDRLAKAMSGHERQMLEAIVHRARNPEPQRPATPLAPSLSAQPAAQGEPVGAVMVRVKNIGMETLRHSGPELFSKYQSLPTGTLLYAHPPAAAQPMTEKQVIEGFCKQPHFNQFVEVFKAGVRFAEKFHGIGAQEG